MKENKKKFNPLTDPDVTDPEVRKILNAIKIELNLQSSSSNESHEQVTPVVENFLSNELLRLEKIYNLFTTKFNSLNHFNNKEKTLEKIELEIEANEKIILQKIDLREFEKIWSKSFY